MSWQRPSWDEYLMSLAFMVSSRSLDPSTKHGCVIVDCEHTILTMGYNSPPRGCDDSKIPLTRPEKYPYFVHSEEAAVANAARSGIPLRSSIAYITGIPCSRCFRTLLNAGVKEFVIGPLSSACVDLGEIKVIRTMLAGRPDVIVRSVIQEIPCGVFNTVIEYINDKLKLGNSNTDLIVYDGQRGFKTMDVG